MISFIGMKIKNSKSLIPEMIIMSLMTLIFIYVFGIGFSQEYIPKVGIVDYDKSQVSNTIIEGLKNNQNYEFINDNFEDSINKVKKSELIGVILIDKGFETKLKSGEADISFYKSGNSIEQVTLENKLDNLIKDTLDDQYFIKEISLFLKNQGEKVSSEGLYNKLLDNKNNFKSYKTKAIFYQKADNIKYNTLKSSFSGFLLFFSMFTIMFGIGSIVEEKELKVWQRQLVSPLSKKSIITGNLISNFIVSMIQILAVVLISKFVFNIEWGGSTLALLCILSTYAMAGTAMGLFIAGFVKTAQQLSAILPTIIVSSSMIGGCMWPVEMMQSKILRNISNVLPQRWGMDGLSKVIIYNGGMNDIKKPILYLLTITIVFLLASIFPYKKMVKLSQEKTK